MSGSTIQDNIKLAMNKTSSEYLPYIFCLFFFVVLFFLKYYYNSQPIFLILWDEESILNFEVKY